MRRDPSAEFFEEKVTNDLLIFECSICGEPATTIGVIDAGVRPPGYPVDAPDWRIDQRRLMVETSGSGSWTTPIGPDEDPLQVWRARDFKAIRSNDSQATGNYCFSCEAWYCRNHSPIERVIEDGGAPMYDWHWESVCPQGHTRTFSRW